VETPRRVTPARLRRLVEELDEEGVTLAGDAADVAAVAEELDYALHPPRHERRIPAYGAIALPSRPVSEWAAVTGLDIAVNATPHRTDDEVRRYADGLVSWAVRDRGGLEALAVFDRAAGSERDLVVLAEATGGVMVQRRAGSVVRVVGPFGVARWDGVGWHVEPPVASWLPHAGAGLGAADTQVLDQLLRFAVHDLGARGVGALFVFAPAGTVGSFEERLPTPPALRIVRPTDLGPLHHVLTQVDGAVVLDREGTLRNLGVRLVPSRRAETGIPAIGGTRHTSARRYSFDHPEAILVAVSESGPVTVFRAGEVVGHSPLADGPADGPADDA
jgi:hypothetical protein